MRIGVTLGAGEGAMAAKRLALPRSCEEPGTSPGTSPGRTITISCWGVRTSLGAALTRAFKRHGKQHCDQDDANGQIHNGNIETSNRGGKPEAATRDRFLGFLLSRASAVRYVSPFNVADAEIDRGDRIGNVHQPVARDGPGSGLRRVHG